MCSAITMRAMALASEEPLTAEERKSRETIVSRQVTIRN